MTDRDMLRFLLTTALTQVGDVDSELPWTDEQLDQMIAAERHVKHAAALLLALAAARIASGARSIKTFDLDVSVDTTQAARVLLDIADRLRGEADDEVGVGDPTTVSVNGDWWGPELALFRDVAPWT